MYEIRFTKLAEKHKKLLKQAGIDEKARKLLSLIAENPYKNHPPYEALVGDLKGFNSRRINIQHRLVYQVYNEPVIVDEIEYQGTIKIVRMWTHYNKI